MTEEIDLKINTASTYKCKKCGFKVKGLIGVKFSPVFNGESSPRVDAIKEWFKPIKLCYKCWYDWNVANLGELEEVSE